MSGASPPSRRSGDNAFINEIVESYENLYAEIQEGDRAEHDLMPRLIRHVFRNTLGWDAGDYEQEDEWNDIRFFNEDRNPVIIVEGKRRGRDVSDGIEQVFRYASETPYVDYIISTNIDELVLFEDCSSDHLMR
jgi:hypothetical protein